jgi:hypothetical protein
VAGALSRLALASTHLHPDDIPELVAREAAALGALDAVVYLVDMEQRVLVPFLAPGAAEVDVLAIDGTIGGRAYRTERPVVVADSAAVDGDDDTTTLWTPLLDSAERFGVVRLRVPDPPDDATTRAWVAFTNVVGELIANKSQYGDVIVKRRRVREMSIAAELRWAMVPPLTFSGPAASISGVLEPAYDVAGDTFDYAVNADTAHIAIIDAVGHGLEASRIANMAVIAYRHSRRLDAGLAAKYRAMDAAVAGEFGIEKFATAQLAHLTLSTGQLQWLNAGHPAPIVSRHGTPFDLVAEPCLPVGLAARLGTAPPRVVVTPLQPGDVVLFFTDGVVEARSPDGEEFGRARLGDLLVRALAGEQTPAETARLLAHAVLAHQAGVLQDDATLVLLVWNGPPVPHSARAG